MRKITGLLIATLCFAFFAATAGELDTGVKRQLDQAGLKYSIDKDNDFRLEFEDGNTVIVNSNIETYKDISIREVWVSLGNISQRKQSLMFAMLRENNKKKIGAFSIITDDGKSYALFTVKLSSLATKEELKSAILFCANTELPE